MYFPGEDTTGWIGLWRHNVLKLRHWCIRYFSIAITRSRKKLKLFKLYFRVKDGKRTCIREDCWKWCHRPLEVQHLLGFFHRTHNSAMWTYLLYGVRGNLKIILYLLNIYEINIFFWLIEASTEKKKNGKLLQQCAKHISTVFSVLIFVETSINRKNFQI